jgi:hypothetical protein
MLLTIAVGAIAVSNPSHRPLINDLSDNVPIKLRYCTRLYARARERRTIVRERRSQFPASLTRRQTRRRLCWLIADPRAAALRAPTGARGGRGDSGEQHRRHRRRS